MKHRGGGCKGQVGALGGKKGRLDIGTPDRCAESRGMLAHHESRTRNKRELTGVMEGMRWIIQNGLVGLERLETYCVGDTKV